LRAARLCRNNFDLAVTAFAVIIERILFGNDHSYLPLSACWRLWAWLEASGAKEAVWQLASEALSG
jgi:hypothetical protein